MGDQRVGADHLRGRRARAAALTCRCRDCRRNAVAGGQKSGIRSTQVRSSASLLMNDGPLLPLQLNFTLFSLTVAMMPPMEESEPRDAERKECKANTTSPRPICAYLRLPPFFASSPASGKSFPQRASSA
jgi:hypothetical protein